MTPEDQKALAGRLDDHVLRLREFCPDWALLLNALSDRLPDLRALTTAAGPAVMDSLARQFPNLARFTALLASLPRGAPGVASDSPPPRVGQGRDILTRNALEKGRIGMPYLLSDPKGRGYVVVDEDRRLIAVNGDVFGFDDVREVGYQGANGGHRLDFTLRSGIDPVRSAVIGNGHYAKSAYAKAVNTLGLA